MAFISSYKESLTGLIIPSSFLMSVSFPPKGLVTPGNGYVTEGKRTKMCRTGLSGDKFISSAARGSRDRYVGHRSQAMTT